MIKKIESSFDIRKKDESHNNLVNFMCDYLKENNIINETQYKKIKQDFWVEDIPVYDLNKSLFYQKFAIEAKYRVHVNGHVVETNKNNKIKYPVVSFCEDIRNLDLVMVKLYEQILSNK